MKRFEALLSSVETRIGPDIAERIVFFRRLLHSCDPIDLERLSPDEIAHAVEVLDSGRLLPLWPLLASPFRTLTVQQVLTLTRIITNDDNRNIVAIVTAGSELGLLLLGASRHFSSIEYVIESSIEHTDPGRIFHARLLARMLPHVGGKRVDCWTYFNQPATRRIDTLLYDCSFPTFHRNWFGTSRVVETLAPDFSDDAHVIIGNTASPPVKATIDSLCSKRIGFHRSNDGSSSAGGYPVGVLSAGRARRARILDNGNYVLCLHDSPRLPCVAGTTIDLNDKPDETIRYEVLPRASISVAGDEPPFHYDAPPLSILRIPRARLGGLNSHLIITKEKFVISESYFMARFMKFHGISGPVERIPREISEISLNLINGIDDLTINSCLGAIDVPVFLINSTWKRNIGHLFHDVSPQIGVWRKYLAPHGVKLLTISPNPVELDFLRFLGVSESDFIRLDQLSYIEVDDLFVCNTFVDQGSDLRPETAYVQDLTLAWPRANSVAGEGGRKIYASRLDAKIRKIANEADVAAALRDVGFEIAIGSKMTLAEQQQLFSAASIVVGPHGANLASLFFCPPGCRMIEMVTGKMKVPMVRRLTNIFGMQHHYFVMDDYAAPPDHPPDEGHFDGIVDIPELMKVIAPLLGDR